MYAGRAREAMATAASCRGGARHRVPREPVQRLVHPPITEQQRPRHLLAQDQELRDANKACSGCRGRAIDRRAAPIPSAGSVAHCCVSSLPADRDAVRQQDEIFHIEDARSVIGALDEGAELAEKIGVARARSSEQQAPRNSIERCGPSRESRAAGRCRSGAA